MNAQDPGPTTQDLSGVLVVDKPEGPTSHDVVTLTRRALGVSRVGHTGTLDPLATGVLPLVIGRATRLAQFLTSGDKHYEATIAFGRRTDTYDVKGRELAVCDRRPARDDLEAALTRFRGTFEQTPPAYSAKNIDGERSYELARRQKSDVRPKPVAVTVRRLELVSFNRERATLDMTVSAGFYVRSLAHDLGELLGCGAVLLALRRTRSGEFDLASAVPLAAILASSREQLVDRVLPMSAVLKKLPAVALRARSTLERLKNGVELGPDDFVAPLPAVLGALAAPEARRDVVVRLLTPEGDLAGLAKPGKEPGRLHGWIVLA